MLRLDATQKKRWMGFDFRFKKFRIKQATFISEILSPQVEAPKQKKIEVFFRCFLRFFFAPFSAFFENFKF